MTQGSVRGCGTQGMCPSYNTIGAHTSKSVWGSMLFLSALNHRQLVAKKYVPQLMIPDQYPFNWLSA